MTEELLDRWSTNASTRTEPSSGLKATGYTDGSQPAADNWNWIMGEAIDKINDVIKHSPSGLQEDSGLDTLASSQHNVFAKYYPKTNTSSWDLATAVGSEDRRTHDLGNLKFVGMCPWIDPDDDKLYILCLEGGSSCNVKIFDPSTWTDADSGDLSSGGKLPSGSSEDWQPCAMCTDGTYVYITFQDVFVTPNETHRIQCYDPSDWSVNASWPSTGTAISGTGTCATGWALGDVRVVSPTLVAVSCPWTTITGATDAAIATYQISDGALVAEGAGSATVGFINTISSDSTDIFGVNINNAKIERATIASLGVAPATYPYSGSTMLDVMCVGGVVISSSAAGASILNFGTYTEEQLCDSATGNNRICYTGGKLEFDGTCIWMRGSVLVNATEKNAIFRIDPNNVTYESTGNPYAMPNMEDIIKTTIIVDVADAVDDYYQAMAPMCFDGRDIWFIGDMRSGEDLTGILYRIPKAVLR